MRLPSLGIIFLLLSSIMFVGCQSVQVKNVSDATYTSTGQSISQADITGAIVTAGLSLGWIMDKRDPGHIVGTLNLRTHRAVVDITYDLKSYNITYKESQNLNYDGTNIHKNYNGWVKNLTKAIDVQVSGL